MLMLLLIMSLSITLVLNMSNYFASDKRLLKHETRGLNFDQMVQHYIRMCKLIVAISIYKVYCCIDSYRDDSNV